MKKMMNKRILALVLSIVMVLGMKPMSVFSVEEGEYDLWVGGERVNSANASDVFGDGKVSYDPGNNVLTLINYTYEGTGHSWTVDDVPYCAAIYYGGDGALTVAAEGTNCLENTADELGHGIYATKGLTVSGSGTLYITTKGYGSQGIYAVSGDVTIENGSTAVITTQGQNSNGIWAINGSVTVGGAATVTTLYDGEGRFVTAHGIYTQGGSVTVTGTAVITTQGGDFRSIYAEGGDVTISGGSVTVEKGSIRADSGDVTIGDSSVTVENAMISADGDVTISDSAVNALGISAGGDVNISDSAVNTSNGGTAIYAYCNVTISGSARVSVTNFFLAGIYAQTGDVTISDDAKVYITVTHTGILGGNVTISDSTEVYVKGGSGTIRSYTEISLGAELSIHLPSGGAVAKDTIMDSDGSTEATEVLIAKACAHSFDTGWSYNSTHHWHACENGCIGNEYPAVFAGIEGSGYEAHSSSCSTCGYGNVTTDLYVGGTALPDGYYLTESGIVTNVQPQDSYAHYANDTLTFSDYTCFGQEGNSTAIWYGGDGTLTIDGAVTIDTAGSSLNGITAENGNVTVSGEAVIHSGNVGITAENGDVTVSGKVDIHAEGNGIYGDSGVKVTGTVNIKTTNVGILTNGSVTISNGKVTVTGTSEDTVGICGDLTVSGSNSTVEISVGYEAIQAFGSITLKDGIAVVEPCGGMVAQHTESYPDFSLTYYTIAVNGTSVKTVKLVYGVPAHSGGTATCKDKAICSVCGQGYGELATHSFQNGKCMVCGEADPDIKADSTNPKTGDDSFIMLWVALLLVSGGALAALTVADRRKRVAADR